MDRQQEKIRLLIKKVNSSEIASLKSIVSRIFEIIDDPATSAKQLEDAIIIEPALANRVLKLANSAYFSSKTKFSQIKEAIMWIGFDAVKELAVTQKLHNLFLKDLKMGSYSRAMLWRNCYSSAVFAKMIYRREFANKGEDAYTAALLRNIGIIVLDQFKLRDYSGIIQRSDENNLFLHLAEKQVLGFDHTDLAKALAESWNFPPVLLNAMAYHHSPEKADRDYVTLLKTIFIANHFCMKSCSSFIRNYDTDEKKYKRYLKDLKIKPHAIDVIAKDFFEELERVQAIGFYN